MVTICNYSFDGPYEVGKKVIDRAAVYVISDRIYKVIDVGQSGEAGTRLLTHDRKSCWDRNDGKWFAIKWMPSNTYTEQERRNLESHIRSLTNPPCGKI